MVKLLSYYCADSFNPDSKGSKGEMRVVIELTKSLLQLKQDEELTKVTLVSKSIKLGKVMTFSAFRDQSFMLGQVKEINEAWELIAKLP